MKKLLSCSLAVATLLGGVGIKAHAAPGTGLNVSLENPSFEMPVGTSLIPGWNKKGTNSTISVVNTVASRGAYSVMVTDNSNTTSTGIESNLISVKPGEVYEASVDVNLQSKTSGSLYLRYFDSNNNLIKSFNTETANELPVNQWDTLTVSGTVPEGATKASVYLYSSIASQGTILFDNVVFEKAIPNFSFEDSDSTYSSWFQRYGSNSITIDTQKAHEGNNSIKIVDNDSTTSYGIQSENMDISPGKTYTASVWANSNGASMIYIRYYDVKGALIHSAHSLLEPTNDEWKQVSVTSTAPSDASFAKVLLYSNVSNVGVINFDDVTFVEEKPVTYSNVKLVESGQQTPLTQQQIQQNYTVIDGSGLVSTIQANGTGTGTVTASTAELEANNDVKNVEIPKGATVINFETEEDYKKFLSLMNSLPNNFENTIIGGELSAYATATGTSTKYHSTSYWFAATAKLRIDAAFNTYSSGSFRQITSVKSSSSYLYGVTLGTEWELTSKSNWISSNRQRAQVTHKGLAHYVLFVKGVGKWFSERRTYTLNYNI